MGKKRGKNTLSPNEKRTLNKANLRKVLSVFRFVLPYKSKFVLGMACLLVSSIVLISLPFVVGLLVDEAQGNNTWWVKGIHNIGLLLVGILVVQSIFSFLRVYLFSQFSERAMADIRLSLYSKFLVLPMSFYDNRRVGELMSRVASDVSLLQSVFSTTLAELFRQVVTLIAGVTIVFVITPRLSVFMLLSLPVVVIAAMAFGMFIRKLSRKTQDELAKTNVIVEETLQSINVVKAFVNEMFEFHKYRRSVMNVVHLAIKTSTFQGLFISFVIFFMMGGIIGVVWYGAYLVQDPASGMTIGKLTSFVFYTMFMGGSIAGIGSIYTELQRAVGSSERVLEILQEEGEGELADQPQTASAPILNGSIKFDKVGFSYPGRKDVQVLEEVTLSINEGDKVALVGESGAGKSTNIQLLMRFYELETGKISIGGQDINSVPLNAYRSMIGVVPQEVVLFGGSIKENIAYGKTGATMDEIRQAAEKANALQFIEQFPEGFDTLVGERGVKLSGGQRQRLAIARAILKDPAILVLDEATSALDASSEALVQKALETLMENRTTIIIAHRLATIRKADNIFVIENGRVIESGSHGQLANIDQGAYSNLVKLQFEVD